MDLEPHTVGAEASPSTKMEEPGWFRSRHVCGLAFWDILKRLSRCNAAEEQDFLREWMESVASRGGMSKGGWYSPPPLGASVLAASPPHFDRLNFSSLRDPIYFAGPTIIDWKRGALFAYCSNVELETGIPGDFSVTLYFGEDAHIVDHFVNCLAATQQIIALAKSVDSSRTLFAEAVEVLGDFGLRNVIQSRTDAAVLDLGHSLESCGRVAASSSGILSSAICDSISRSRRFINMQSDWSLSDASAFTLEPQLLSTRDEGLPKVSLHYALARSGATLIVDDPMCEVDTLEPWRQK